MLILESNINYKLSYVIQDNYDHVYNSWVSLFEFLPTSQLEKHMKGSHILNAADYFIP